MKVLFVCTANICRSAYASRRAGMFTPSGSSGSPGGAAAGGSAEVTGSGGSRLEFVGAGTHAVGGQAMTPTMVRELEDRGGSADGFVSAAVDSSAMDADLVLTMEQRHKEFVVDEYPALSTRTFTVTQFADALGRVAPGVAGAELVRTAYRARRSSPGDVDDPFGLGQEAARRCADEIDALLAVIVPRLALGVDDD